MKRILFSVVITSTLFVGCKKEKDIQDSQPVTVTTANSTNARIDCDNNAVIRAMRNQRPENILQWVKDNGHRICYDNNEELIECLEPFHKVETKTEFEKLAASHSSNRTVAGIKYYPKKWGDIYNYIKTIQCYENYVGFIFSGSKVDFKQIPISDFENIKESCYSKPFLEGLGRKLNLDPNDYFYFTKAEYSGTNMKVIFYVDKTNVDGTHLIKYYNISDYPGIIDFKKFAKK